MLVSIFLFKNAFCLLSVVDDGKLKKQKTFKNSKAIWNIAWAFVTLVLRLTETSSFCEKASIGKNRGNMESITGTSMPGTRKHENSERKSRAVEFKINDNEGKEEKLVHELSVARKTRIERKEHLKEKRRKTVKKNTEAS